MVTREEFHELTEELWMVYWSHHWSDGTPEDLAPMPLDLKLRVINCVTELLAALDAELD